MLMQTFFISQFSYSPLVWMFCSRRLNTKINNLHYRALRMVHRDDTTAFDELSTKDGSVTDFLSTYILNMLFRISEILNYYNL